MLLVLIKVGIKEKLEILSIKRYRGREGICGKGMLGHTLKQISNVFYRMKIFLFLINSPSLFLARISPMFSQADWAQNSKNQSVVISVQQ